MSASFLTGRHRWGNEASPHNSTATSYVLMNKGFPQRTGEAHRRVHETIMVDPARMVDGPEGVDVLLFRVVNLGR